MSTAGKVLAFLNILVIPVWIFLMAGVAQYNRNGTQAMLKLQQQQAKIEEEIKTVKAQAIAFRDDTNLEQMTTSQELAVIQDTKYAVQKRQSDATEAATRANYDLEDQQKALKTAKQNLEHRIAEKKDMETSLAAAEEEVERLKQVDTKQRVQLKNLRDEFAKVYNANKMKVVKQAQ